MNIYCIAIGGTGMAPLACLLQSQGHRVSGSDGPLYPPMSDLLAAAGIEPFVGWDGAGLERLVTGGEVDLVVVGNAVPRSHPEAQVVERLYEQGRVERISMPQAITRFLLPDRRPLVLCGTHGKTTTTSMAAWTLRELTADPGYLIGGWPIGLDGSFALGSGDRFVLEGDEYNAAYFDRGAKFLHYQPETAVVTSVEWDHADLYPTPESFRDAFSHLVSLLPDHGHLVACAEEPEVRRLASSAGCRVTLYGLGDGAAGDHADVRITRLEADASGMRFLLDGSSELLEGQPRELELQVWGVHNALNATAVWCATRRDGWSHERVAAALARFRGVHRRLEELGTVAGVTVVDDFAHHPTEVEKSVDGLRRRYAGRVLTVAFEPRSISAGRALLHDDYLRAFERCDRVLLAPIFHADRLEDDERLDLEQLAVDLRRDGVEVMVAGSTAEIERELLATLGDGDVVATMSSGSFDGLPTALVEGLQGRQAAGA